MATTKIWDVSAHVSKLLAYVANKNKTTMEFENKSFDESEKLAAEILGLPYDHFATEASSLLTCARTSQILVVAKYFHSFLRVLLLNLSA